MIIGFLLVGDEMKKIKLIEDDYPLVKPRERKIKSWIEFEKFLLKMDKMPSSVLYDIMGVECIYPPGNYRYEGKSYHDVIEYVRVKLGDSTYQRLKKWYIYNPKKVREIMAW